MMPYIMQKAVFIWMIVCIPGILHAQNNTDSISLQKQTKNTGSVKSEKTVFPIMFNISSVFYSTQDSKINKFLGKYGYTQPQQIPVGLRFELAGIPNGGRMVYSLNAGTIVSRQDITTADISLGVYYRFVKSKKISLLSGVAIGEHFDRIVLNGALPPNLDSLAIKYNTTLSLHRTGLIVEPAVKFFWYPLQAKKIRVGLYTGIYYNMDFNSRWRVGYYPHNGHTFKNLRKSTQVSTVEEYGWSFSTGLSISF
jgi:hypothetical protein